MNNNNNSNSNSNSKFLDLIRKERNEKTQSIVFNLVIFQIFLLELSSFDTHEKI
jgi:hypothetical protein